MKMTRAIRLLRDLYPEMPLQTLYVFLLVGEQDGAHVRQSELLAKAGMSDAALSRNLSSLDEWSWVRKPGLQLVETKADVMDRRQRLVSLSRKGRTLYDRLQKISEEGAPEGSELITKARR
jgi:DNA-binding MarR family transcriptional regulator